MRRQVIRQPSRIFGGLRLDTRECATRLRFDRAQRFAI
jgi:hypothetical protein